MFRKICAIPFKVLHRVLGTIMSLTLVGLLVAGLASVVLLFVGLTLSAIVGAVLWLCIAGVFAAVGSALLAMVRALDPDYFSGRENTVTNIVNTVKDKGDGLRGMAKDHL